METKILNFKTTQEEIKKLEDLLICERKKLESQKRQMYKSVYAKLNIFFRRSKTYFAEVVRLGEVTEGIPVEEFCQRSPIKNISWWLSQTLLFGDSGRINTKFIEDFTIGEIEIEELNKAISDYLKVSLLNDSYFIIMKK